MKRLILLLFAFFYIIQASAQREDNVWIFGYHYYNFNNVLDFYNGNPFITGANSPLEFDGCATSICDINGDLLLYTNGVGIMNGFHNDIPGSLHFNDDASILAISGIMLAPPKQSAFILAYPGHPDQYIVIHHSWHVWNSISSCQPVALSMSVVDMAANGGAGQMIIKNQTIINDTLLFETLQTVRHANGRDWWIMVHKWMSDKFYQMLLTPAGISNVQLIQSGPNFTTSIYHTQSVFSPDGNYFAIARGDSNMVTLFDFDRCTGTLTFKDEISLIPISNSNYITGCSFSPSSQFLYASDDYSLYQFDMNASNIPNSKILIDNWDGSGGFNPYYFLMHQLGPDGKIYISPPPCIYLHVINNPDLADTACNFTQHSMTLLNWHSGVIPVFPNYHLGSVAGSACDTLNISTVENNSSGPPVTIYPSPNSGDFYVEYVIDKFTVGKIEISDITGRLVYTGELSKSGSRQHIHLTQAKQGIYVMKLNNGRSTMVKKFIITE